MNFFKNILLNLFGEKKVNNKLKISKFLDMEKESTLKFNLDNIKGNFYVKSVYDGDTITILIPMSISIYNYDILDFTNIDLSSNNNPDNKINCYEVKIRLLGIDTPEMKPLKSLLNREEHIKKAQESRDYLKSIILNKIIRVEFKSNDKYGRALGILFIDNININELMIEKGYAKLYDGGKKETD